MYRIYPCLLFVLISFFSNAQSTVTISGKIIDNISKLPMESATVYLTSVKDSTMIDYTISDKNGVFSLVTKRLKDPVMLKVSFVGFAAYSQQVKEILQNRDFGVLPLEENPNVLGEVVIKSEAPPVRIKQDTLEFNASSLKVRPDANVEALLKQLPGVEVDANGKITVNGKEVNNVLVNGKPFFGKDGKVATQNLPSDIINKVQISDTKTKEEELAGQAASSENKTINLTIQEDKNKGLFGKFSAGVGSDNRYEASGLINYFKDKRKLSFLGSSNNINSVGFSMDEIFDSMGGGRNVYSSGDGSFNIDGQQFGGGNGITLSNMIGLNYSDEIAKKIEPAGSYFYSSTENNNSSRSNELNLQNDATETSESTTRTISNAHNLNFEIEYKIDSLTTLNISPQLKRSNSHYTGRSTQASVNAEGVLQNDSDSYNNSTSNNAVFENNLYFFRKLKKKGRSVSLYFANQNNADDSEQLTMSETTLYLDNEQISRNQIQRNENTSDNYDTNVTYTEPITDSLSISVGTKLLWNTRINDKNTFDYDPISDAYTAENDVLSNYISSNTRMLYPFTSMNIRKKKFSARLGVGTEFTSYNNSAEYMGVLTRLDKNYVYPKVNGNLNYRMTKSKSIYLNYNYNVSLPAASQMLPIENLSNPLNTIIGNPDLDPASNHRMYFGFNNYDYASKSGFYLYSGGSFVNNRVVTSTVYDENAKRETTYENVDNTYNGYMGFNWNKSFKKEQHTFKIGFGLNSNFSLSKGLSNLALFEARSYSLTPEADLSWEYGELLTVSPSYSFNYNTTDFTNYSIGGSSYFVHNLKLQTTSYWPKHFVFGNDFGYTYNSNIADGFRKDFFLWNTSLGYNFYNDKFLAKVKVYDLLDQNVNAKRTVTADAIQDVENTVLQRYIMFSLTYKIEKFGGKQKEGSGRRFH